MNRKTRIFAYGSLLSEESLRRTVPDADELFPAKVHGFQRVFNLASHYRFCSRSRNPVCVLNLEQAGSSATMNGVCFDMPGDSFRSLRSREQIYRMHEVSVHHYEDDSFQGRATLFWAMEHALYSYLPDSTEQKHYLDLCLSGCRVYGNSFVRDFKNTTRFWGVEDQHDVSRIWQGAY